MGKRNESECFLDWKIQGNVGMVEKGEGEGG